MSKRQRRKDCWFAFDVAERPNDNLGLSPSRDLVARCSIRRSIKCPFYDNKTGVIEGAKCEFFRG